MTTLALHSTSINSWKKVKIRKEHLDMLLFSKMMIMYTKGIRQLGGYGQRGF